MIGKKMPMAADFDYPYEVGDYSVWRSNAEIHGDGRDEERPSSLRAGFNWITGREEDEVNEQEEKARRSVASWIWCML